MLQHFTLNLLDKDFQIVVSKMLFDKKYVFYQVL